MATMAYRWKGGHGSEEYLPKRMPKTAHSKTTRLELPSIRVAQDLIGRHKRPAMVEFYTVKRIDNSRFVRHVEPVKMRNLYKTAALGAIVALFFMFFIYQHFRCIDLSFQLEDMKAKQETAAAVNGALKLEIATLRDPHRIDVIARHQLGLTQPTPAQVREDANFDGAELASARYVRPNHAP